MSKSIGKLLEGRFAEPPEIQSIKQYIKTKYHADVGVTVKDEQIVLNVASSALANTLRLEKDTIQQIVNTDKKLVFRIGGLQELS